MLEKSSNPPPRLIDRILQARSWWVVRGESGALWSSLFQPRGIVAHGRLVERFSEKLDFVSRQQAMLALDEFGQKEVNDFIDVMEEDDVIVTPDEGTRAAWFGVVVSDWFAAEDCEHWIQRRCDWLDRLVALSPEATRALPRGPLGTVFNVTGLKPVLAGCVVAASGR